MKEKISIKKIKPNPNNPRYIRDSKFKKLVKSIKEFPEMFEKRPIIVDENLVVLGGNMRLKACESAGLFEVWIDKDIGWSEKQKQEFIIKDNVGFGDWDFDMLANEWNTKLVDEWGLNLPEFIDPDDLGTDFDLPDGDKEPFQQQTYILADKQVEIIKNALNDIKKTDDFKFVETFGNENSNGNALYLLVSQWVGQKK